MVNKKLIILISFFFISSCDEDYVSSLNFVNPKVSLELVNNLDNLYLGEPVDNVEIILKVEDSPSISSIALSLDYNSDYFRSDTVLVSSQENNFFYNVSPNAMIDNFFAFTDSTFEVNTGFINDQDTTYSYGNGEIVRLFLSGRNVETNIDLSLDNVLSYDFDVDIDDWYIEDIVIGKPIPQIYLDNFIYDEDIGLLTMDMVVIDFPKLTDAQISVDYDSDVLAFINESIPDPGNLINQGFDLSFIESNQGEITFSFSQSDGNESSFISGGGNLVNLKFNTLVSNLDSQSIGVNFGINFENAIFDVCGECSNPEYSEYYLYDISYWNEYIFSGLLFGCADQSALNYNINAIIDDGSCIYE